MAIFGYLILAGLVVAGIIWVLDLRGYDGEAIVERNDWIALVALAAPGVVAVIGFLVWDKVAAIRDHGWKINIGAMASLFRVLLILFLLVGLLAAPFYARSTIVSKVESGENVTVGLPFLRLLTFREVSLDVERSSRPAECVILLGYGHGLTVYFDSSSAQIGQVPIELSTVHEPCREAA
jgi:hypothetical protein